MRKLFKSAFKSIIKSKIGIILLSSIVFLTAGTFTLFNSASNSFQQSYKSVTEKGNLHDFTVKELYSVQGSPNLDVTTKDTTEIQYPTEKITNDNDEYDFSTITAGGKTQKIVSTDSKGEKYLMVPTSELGTSIEVYENSNEVNGAFRIKFDDLLPIDTNKDGNFDTFIPKAPDKISIDWMYEEGSKPSLGSLFAGLFGGTSSNSTPDKLKTEKDNNWKKDSKWNSMFIEEKDVNKKYVSKHSSNKNNFVIIPGNKDFHVWIPKIESFYQKLFEYMKKTPLPSYENINYKEISITPNGMQTSSYDFFKNWTKDDFKSHLPNNENYPILIEATKLSSSNWNDPEKIKSLPKVSKIIEELKDSLKKEAIARLSTSFTNEVNTLYGQNGSKKHLLNMSSVKTIQVNSSTGARKIVSTDSNTKVDNLVKFEGNDLPKNIKLKNKTYQAPISNKDMEEILRSFNKDTPKKGEKNLSIINKDFKISAGWIESKLFGLANIPHNASFIDPTSFMAIVSPSYAKENKLEYINPNKIISLYEEAITNHSEEAMKWLGSEFRNKYPNSVVWVDKTPYIAIGSGTTPDFSYPIVGPDKPMPNVRDEAILFTNKHGYQRIEDAFRGSPKEDYLAYKFTPQAHGKEEEIFKDIESIAQKHMSWGNSVDNIASRTFDTSETVILAQNRISFLSTLQSSMLTLSVILTVSLITFIIIVISLVIKKHINSHKKNYGILLANGYSKAQIALASTVISLVSIIIPAGLGYITGHFMQYLLLNQFANVWTLPISGHAFNWWAFISIIVFPFLLVSLLAFVITMWEIRGSIPEILSGVSSKMSSYLSSKILGPLKFVGIKTKASMSLFITNISKMLLVFVSTAMAIITIAVSISTIHKFDDAKASSAVATSYSYDVAFSAPTNEGGLLKATHLYELGLTDDQKDDNQKIDPDLQGTDVIKDRNSSSHNSDIFMVPQKKDEDWNTVPNYLNHLIQTKTLLNLKMGIGNLSANPWDLAKKLMPENQMNIATDKDIKFIQFAASLDKNKEYLPDGDNAILKIENNNFVIDESKASKITKVSDHLRNFFWNGFKAAYQQYKSTGSLENMPYFITYGSIILGNNDETYTNITGYTTKSNFKKSSSKHDFSIKGIKEKSRNITLSSSAQKALAQKALLDKNGYLKTINGELDIPVIVNKYFAAYYKVKEGDIINYEIINAADRFKNGPSGLSTRKIRLKIVGFQDSYNDQQVYTLQKYAQQAMGWQDKPEMFNGVFTQEKNPVVFNSLGLYSTSGLYPGTDTIVPRTDIYKNIEEYIQSKSDPNYKLPNAVKDIDDYIETYSKSPYVTFSNVNWKGAESFRFKTTSDLSSVLIIFIESITIFLSILFIIIISIMMIEDNKKFISTLKVMGYRSREITKIFFGSFIPSFVLAIFVSAPIAFGVAELIRFAIMSFGSILIPLSLTWWTILISFGITFTGAMVTYWLSTRSLKNTRMLQAFAQ